jgi:hypothetical protein
MKRVRDSLLSPEDFARLRAMSPKVPKEAIALKQRKESSPFRKRLKVSPVVVLERVEKPELSKDYLSLRAAISDPRLPVAKASSNIKDVLFIGDGQHIWKSQWVALAWAEKHKSSKTRVRWASSFYSIKGYIFARNGHNEAEQMLKWWDGLLNIVPYEIPLPPPPSDEELLAWWKELEAKMAEVGMKDKQ